jgi:phosphate transport system substrate-binding protein
MSAQFSVVPFFVSAQIVTIKGAGSTFVFPLMDTWRIAFQKVRPNVNINYQSIGSGAGVKQFTPKTVDFGACDAPLTHTHKQLQELSGAQKL